MQYILYMPKIQANYNFVIHCKDYYSYIEIPCNSCPLKRDDLCTGINKENIESIYSILSMNCGIIDVTTILKKEKFNRIYTESVDFQINELQDKIRYKISTTIDHT